MNGTNLMLIFQAIIGIYMVYAAVTDKGKLYENKNIIKGKEKEYHKIMRALCIAVGPLCLVSAVLGYAEINIILSYVLLVLMFAYVVYVAVKIRKLTNPLSEGK